MEHSIINYNAKYIVCRW